MTSKRSAPMARGASRARSSTASLLSDMLLMHAELDKRIKEFDYDDGNGKLYDAACDYILAVEEEVIHLTGGQNAVLSHSEDPYRKATFRKTLKARKTMGLSPTPEHHLLFPEITAVDRHELRKRTASPMQAERRDKQRRIEAPPVSTPSPTVQASPRTQRTPAAIMPLPAASAPRTQPNPAPRTHPDPLSESPTVQASNTTRNITNGGAPHERTQTIPNATSDTHIHISGTHTVNINSGSGQQNVTDKITAAPLAQPTPASAKEEQLPPNVGLPSRDRSRSPERTRGPDRYRYQSPSPLRGDPIERSRERFHSPYHRDVYYARRGRSYTGPTPRTHRGPYYENNLPWGQSPPARQLACAPPTARSLDDEAAYGRSPSYVGRHDRSEAIEKDRERERERDSCRDCGDGDDDDDY